jgi:hypothetical protein
MTKGFFDCGLFFVSPGGFRRADKVRRFNSPARSAAFRFFAVSAGRCQPRRPAKPPNHVP